LQGWPLPHGLAQLPCINYVTQDALDKIIENLYNISIPQFHKEERLYLWIKVCTISLIMHFKNFNWIVGQTKEVSVALVEAETSRVDY
jgi:hypothetical protein